ncbi:putative acetyltransferase [Psychromicrobium silvestre]|uniref:Putative acetyltransferase n=1 Tax=Psychromicrobium silvestre TaxID=1645614 RepID=A0A7Y9LR99_9MICC|nr:GNAT family N-acetyltransferase [Psychromicrobium silvestre]NYE94136.1 putative acetyltransferase [Psychromicrobium silvestre]
MSFDELYEIRRFPAARKGEPGYEQAVEWIRAVNRGFHQPKRSEEQIESALKVRIVDRREQTGVYQRQAVAPHSFGAEAPVATFGTLRKEVNIGFGRMLLAQLVTAVTVRASHRRRGILSRVMHEDLQRAKQDGLALAALNASEAVIYRRFGFGVATKERHIKVDVGPRFSLRHRPIGTVEGVPRQVLLDLAPEVFSHQHVRSPGSIDRQESYRYQAAGFGPWAIDEDENVLSALHYDVDGQVDGYVSYLFQGWDSKPQTMSIIDLAAANDGAYLELWRYLASLDLVEQIEWSKAPNDDPLEWALEDRRCLQVQEEKDMLWLRVLDVAQALEARKYSADGELSLRVEDRLGLSAGNFVLTVQQGEPHVRLEAGERSVDLSLDIAELASIYLGGVLPSTLLAAGQLTEHTPGSVLLAQRMFALERTPFCATHF